METEKIVREKYRDLINDIDFEKMELLLKSPNIFQILNVSRAEIRHSNFLAWLLDPAGTHGLGKLFLAKFLQDISTLEQAIELDELEIVDLNFNSVELRREWRNIDLLVIFNDLVVCIENKFDSHDHSDQLLRYRQIVDEAFRQHRKVYVYLTPTGEEPMAALESRHYVSYSYEEIIEQAERILKIYGDSINQAVYLYMTDYLRTIKREIVKNDEMNILADKIYKSHRELLDFIFENKTDTASELYLIFQEKISESGWIMGSKHKGYARFLTPKLYDIIPRKGHGWPNKESFLFEIDFHWSKRKAVFKTVISPSDEEIQKVMSTAIENIPGYKKPSGKKWLVHFQHSWKFDSDAMVSVDRSEVKNNLDMEWAKITKIVNDVEREFLKVGDELKRLSSE